MPNHPTRRAFLSTAAVIAAPHVARAEASLYDADVVIVGAGVAGLAAARECQRLNRSFVMLEARRRIGGRVFTDTSLGAPYDAGASYIHWAQTNPWAPIARDLGFATRSDSGERGGIKFYDHGAPIERSARRGGAFDRLSELIDIDPDQVPDISIAQIALNEGEDVIRAAGSTCRMSLGEEPERVSAKDYARLASGDDLTVQQGYGTLVARYGAGVPVQLGMTVTAVDFSGPGVRVETPNGALRGRAAIVTVPLGVLAAGDIRFTPALPALTQEGIAGLAMGLLAKVALKFNGRRFDLPEGVDLFDLEGPRELLDFECWGFGRNLVIAYLGGDHARRVLGQGGERAVAEALEHFVVMVGPEARAAFVAGACVDWQADPFSRGAYSHCRPGDAGAREKLAQPVAGKLWFVGEATGGAGHGGAMTAGGAFLAGREAVRAFAGV